MKKVLMLFEIMTFNLVLVFSAHGIIGVWYIKTQWTFYNIFLGILIWGFILAVAIIFPFGLLHYRLRSN